MRSAVKSQGVLRQGEQVRDTVTRSMGADASVGLVSTPTVASVVTRPRMELPNAHSKTANLRIRAPTPIKLKQMIPFLNSYDKVEAQFLYDGFAKGFRLGYMGPRVTVKSRNLQSAKNYP